MAEGCLAYLLYIIKLEVLTSVSLREYPLAQYAMAYWFEHVRIAQSSTSSALPLARELYLSKKVSLVKWIRLYDAQPPGHWGPICILSSREESQHVGLPMYYASLLGLLEWVHTLLENVTDVNARGGFNGDASQAALLSGHLETTPAQLRESWGENDAADVPEMQFADLA